MATVPQESCKSYSQYIAIAFDFSSLEQMSDAMSDVMFLELWGENV